MISLDLKGVAELNQRLKELEVELQQKALARAAFYAFLPVLEAAKAMVPVDTGLTRDNIKIRTVKPKSGLAVVAVGLYIAVARVRAEGPATASGKVPTARIAFIGRQRGYLKDRKKGDPRAPTRRDPSPHWRWHFIERGTKYQKKRPFLRPALDQNLSTVLERFRTELAKNINRAIRKQARSSR